MKSAMAIPLSLVGLVFVMSAAPAGAICSSAPRLVLEPASCMVGQACDLSLRLDGGSASVASAAAKLESGAIQCSECLPGSSAPGGACFLNPATCSVTVADLAPPITAFGNGVIAKVRITCSQAGSRVITLTNVSLGGTNGLPVDGACGEGASIDCTGPADDIPVCGDVNGNGKLSASDALSVLRASVGQSVNLDCAPYGQTLETGQTECFNADSAVVVCSGTGQDGERQDGLPRLFVDHGDGRMTDVRSGLMWEKLSDDGSIHDRDSVYTWSLAVSTKIALLNSSVFAGYSDWRLPNVNELLSLVDYGGASPAIPVEFASSCAGGCAVTSCSCTSSGTYWSSTPAQSPASSAWVVDFQVGGASAGLRSQARFVRAVRTAP